MNNNIYNKVRKIAKAVLPTCLLSLSPAFNSCSDFLDVLPMNDVVLENYWTKKDDVTSVLNSCYEALVDKDCIIRMGVWGELRSENLRIGTSVPREIEEVVKETLLSSNSMCNWAKFYVAINRCNTVCYYAPKVQEIDPNYSEAEMKANVAEAVAIRSLCYFYLIRTFRDVPYTTQPSIDDGQQYIIPASSFDEVLNSIIADLESVKNDAVRRYDVDRYMDATMLRYPRNSGRITRWSIYAMLADMYLWKGDWNKCIECCDAVLKYKKQQYDEFIEREGKSKNIILFGDSIPLIVEKREGDELCGNAYTEIFGYGSSFESLFELQFTNQDNTWVSQYYSRDRSVAVGYLKPYDELRSTMLTSSSMLYQSTDCRGYENIATNKDYSTVEVMKYAARSMSFKNKGVSSEANLNLVYSSRSDAHANWIIYRLTDVILMKAEALLERNQTDWQDAFNLIDVVNRRANDIQQATATGTLKIENHNTSLMAMEDLLLDERHREFMFEGKRWYDLVRQARRDGNNDRLISNVSRKYVENKNAMKIKLTDPNIIYFPYFKNELKVNPLLKQNPAYGNEENSELSN